MSHLSGGEALVKSLVREGVQVVFGLPGVQLYGIIAALRDEPSIRLIVSRHEQATTYMADGYARSSGKPGVAFVVPGPGIYNAGGGLSTAYARSSPVFLIAGQIPRKTIGKDYGGLHEVNDQMEITNPITKWQKRVLSPSEVPEATHEALRQSRSGRSRPVYLEMPPETMVEKEEVQLLEPSIIDPIYPNTESLKLALKEIRKSHRPIIYVGGGIARSNAEGEFVQFVEKIGIPVITSAGGKGVISDKNPLSLGSSLSSFGELKEKIERSDLILAIGTRFSLRNPIGEKTLVVHLDVDPSVMGKIHRNTLRVVGDLKLSLKFLGENLPAVNPDNLIKTKNELVKIKTRISESEEEHNEPQKTYLNSIREGMPDEAILIAGMTQLGYYSRAHWPTYFPKTYIDSGYSGNLGFSFPTALGVKVAKPETPVVCLVGDGGFMYNSSEISTAVKYGINLVTVIYNDGAYGNVSRDMDDDFGGQYESDFVNPDFVKLAESYGAVGIRCKTPDEIDHIITKSLALDKPVFIDMPVERVNRPKMWSSRAPWMMPQDGLIK